MPEGDTVFRAAKRMHEALAGREVTRFDIRVPGSATADLRGEVVHEVVPMGKHLLHRIGEHTLHSHLKMEGEWHVYRAGGRWRKPAFKARAIVGNREWDAVGFELAMVEVLPTRDEARIVGHLGPDPLSERWDPAEAARRLALDTRAAHVAVLDQRNVAGFGNVYANELLFVRGILPTRPAERGRHPRPGGPRRTHDRRQPRPRGPHLHRRLETRSRLLGVRPRRTALPALRNADRARFAGRRRDQRAQRLLVPSLPGVATASTAPRDFSVANLGIRCQSLSTSMFSHPKWCSVPNKRVNHSGE